MDKLRKTLLLVVSLTGITMASAQEQNSLSSNIGTQFDYILMKSESYRDLKIVKKKWIENLKENVLGSISRTESELSSSKSVLNQQKSQISALQTKLQQTKAELSAYTNSGPTVTFLGIRFNQKLFSTLFTVLLLGSIGAVTFFAFKFKKSNAVTLHSKSVLADLEEEYHEYKRKSIEREQKISRQLQDELNKQKLGNAIKPS
jgi:hypothetical protein